MPLDQMGDPLTQHLVGLEALDRFPMVKNIPLCGTEISINRLEKSGFSGPIGSNNGCKGSLVRGDTHIPQNGDLFHIARGNAFNLERHR